MGAVCVGSDDRGKVMGVDTVSSNAEILVEYGMPAAFVAATLYLAWACPDFSTLTTLLGRKISLRDAAAQLYTKFRGTSVGALMEGPAGTGWCLGQRRCSHSSPSAARGEALPINLSALAQDLCARSK